MLFNRVETPHIETRIANGSDPALVTFAQSQQDGSVWSLEPGTHYNKSCENVRIATNREELARLQSVLYLPELRNCRVRVQAYKPGISIDLNGISTNDGVYLLDPIENVVVYFQDDIVSNV